MKVLFILPYPTDTVPGQRLKFEQYFSYLRENKIEIKICSFISPKFYKILYKKGNYLKKTFHAFKGYVFRLQHILDARKFDVVYLFLWSAPFGPPIFEFLLKKMKKPIVYDIDDLVYLPHYSDANRLFRFFKSKNRIPLSIKMANHVIVCTDYLRKYALQYHKNVTEISSTINTDTYFVNNFYSNDKKITIGWTGSHSTAPYLHLLDNVLRTVQEKYRVGIKVIGDKSFHIPGIDIDAQDWNLATEVQDLQEIDIGLYPLPDEEWILGKSGLKPKQYMALGIPAVCTKIGAVLEFIQDNQNGFLAETEEEWIDKISLLLENPDLRKRIGQTGRKTIEKRYSVQVNAPTYLKIIEKVYEERKMEN